MSVRHRLPNRRPSTSRDFEWLGATWTVSVGWGRQGRVREVFLKGAAAKTGAHVQIGAEDDCFILSRLLQQGARISDLDKSLTHRPTTGDFTSGLSEDPVTDIGTSSLIARAVAVAADIEADEGQDMARLDRHLRRLGLGAWDK